MLDMHNNIQHSPSTLVQCCAKSGKAIPGVVARNDQANFWITNIEKGGQGVQVSQFLWVIVSKIK